MMRSVMDGFEERFSTINEKIIYQIENKGDEFGQTIKQGIIAVKSDVMTKVDEEIETLEKRMH